MTTDPYLDSCQPYRNRAGEIITLTNDQVAAVQHAVYRWRSVALEFGGEHYGYLLRGDPKLVDMHKSCLLGRLLVDGLPAMKEPPELIEAAPAYHLVDPALCPRCGAKRGARGRMLQTDLHTAVFCAEPWHHHA